MCLLGFVLAGTDVAPVEVGYWQGYADAYGVAVEFGGRGFLVAHAGAVAHAEGEVDVGDTFAAHLCQFALGSKGEEALLHNVENMAAIFPVDKAEHLSSRNVKLIEEIAERTSAIEKGVEDLVNARKLANKIDDEHEKAIAYHDKVEPKLDEIRYQIDKLELIVDDSLWPLPKYRELLFIR